MYTGQKTHIQAKREICLYIFFQGEEQTRRMEEDRVNAFDMRKKAMERLSQTKRRKVDEGEETEKKRNRRRSGNDTVEFLREQSENDFYLREQELAFLKEKQEKEERKHDDWKEMMAQQMAQ